jgi:hypothetical protein
MDFLISALSALPQVATSFYAMIAYIATIAAWLFIGWRVHRNNNLLAHLEKLPSHQRLAALESEMGGVRLERGLAPEQWLLARRNRYLFVGFLAILLSITLLICLALVQPLGRIDATADLYQGPNIAGLSPNGPDSDPSEFSAKPGYNLADDESITVQSLETTNFARLHEAQRRRSAMAKNGKADPDFIVLRNNTRDFGYDYSMNGNMIIIKPNLRYFNELRQGKKVMEANTAWPFESVLPIISIKIANNSARTLLLSEVVFKIKRAETKLDPVFFVELSPESNQLEIINRGWGPVSKPSLRLRIGQETECRGPFFLLNAVNVPVGAFDEHLSVDIAEYLNPNMSGQATPKCVRGVLSYQDSSQKEGQLKFQSVIHGRLSSRDGYGPSLASSEKPSAEYEIVLPSDATNQQVRASIAHKITANDVDYFLITMRAHKSAIYNLVMEVRDSAKNTIWSGEFELELFVPRVENKKLWAPRVENEKLFVPRVENKNTAIITTTDKFDNRFGSWR